MKIEQSIENTKLIYNKIFKLLEKHEKDISFNVSELKHKSKLHLFALELKITHQLNINIEQINNLNWNKLQDDVTISYWGTETNREICNINKQPKKELLLYIGFPTGPYIFGYGNTFNKDYPQQFFNKFINELLTYKPKYYDALNKSLYFSMDNAYKIYNVYNDILKKYHKLNKEDIKLRKIEKLQKELMELKN